MENCDLNELKLLVVTDRSCRRPKQRENEEAALLT